MPIPRLALCLPTAALLLAAAGSVPLAAQSVAERRALGALRDSLATVTDSTALRALELATIARAKRNPDNTMLHLRLGLVALRLGELGARRSYDDAASEFTWATELKPDWPWGWYGLGLAELGVGDSEVTLVSGLQTMLGRDALTRSANAYAKSAEVDPAFVEGVVELANTALRQRVNLRADVALAALRRTARTPAGRHPDVLLARGRIEREVGSADSAAAAFRALLRRDSTDATLRLEMARTAFLTGDPAGADLWYDGLARAGDEALAAYRADLAYVLPDSTLAAFDAAPTAAAREAVVREFWAVRDRAELRRDGERLAEHYRRLDFARRYFRLTSTRRQYDLSERFRSGQEEFDDRGIVYIRHGPPDDRTSYVAQGVEANESWRYRREGGGGMILHFVAREDVQDYRLVESAFDVLGFATTVAMRDTERMLGEYEHLEGLIRTREGFDPIYRRLLGSGRGSTAILLGDERALGRLGIRTATTTDSWPLRYEQLLPASVEPVAVGAAAGGPVVQLAFAVAGRGLEPAPADLGPGYPVRVRASALSLDGVPLAALDTTLLLGDGTAVGPEEYLFGRVPMRLPAATVTVRAAVETARGGIITGRDTVRVLDPEAVAPALSDLALGTRRVPLGWPVAGADSAWLNPRGTFRREDRLQLLVEVAGIAPLAPYRLEIAVRRPGGGSFLRRLFGGGGTSVRLAFDAEHPGGLAVVQRELALDRLDPGTYEVEVKLSQPDVKGEVVRRRRLTVVR